MTYFRLLGFPGNTLSIHSSSQLRFLGVSRSKRAHTVGSVAKEGEGICFAYRWSFQESEAPSMDPKRVLAGLYL